MPPPFDDAVVSPELVLIDPELAERARAGLAPRGPQRRQAVPTGASDDAAPPRARRRLVTPALTLLATAAASLVVTAVSGPERASGESPTASKLVHGSPATTGAPVSSPAGDAAAASAQTATGQSAAQPSPGPQQFGVGAAVSAPPTFHAPSTGAPAPVRRLAMSAQTLVWPRSTKASAYDLELVRNGSVIFSKRSPSPRAVVPRRWKRARVRYMIQPEDQVWVWPIVDGRRTAEPAVNGVLALDMTRIAQLIEQTQSRAHP